MPIIVGGTGLYFKVLLEGLSPVPAIDPDVRAYWRGAGRANGRRRSCTPCWPSAIPEMAARLMPTDPQRIVRALEVLESTGRSLADWQREPGTPVLREDETVRLLVLPERDDARRRDRRALRCHAGGRARSRRCARCWRSACPTELPIMRALGVAPLVGASRRRGCRWRRPSRRPRPRRASTPSGS